MLSAPDNSRRLFCDLLPDELLTAKTSPLLFIIQEFFSASCANQQILIGIICSDDVFICFKLYLLNINKLHIDFPNDMKKKTQLRLLHYLNPFMSHNFANSDV